MATLPESVVVKATVVDEADGGKDEEEVVVDDDDEEEEDMAATLQDKVATLRRELCIGGEAASVKQVVEEAHMQLGSDDTLCSPRRCGHCSMRGSHTRESSAPCRRVRLTSRTPFVSLSAACEHYILFVMARIFGYLNVPCLVHI